MKNKFSIGLIFLGLIMSTSLTAFADEPTAKVERVAYVEEETIDPGEDVCGFNIPEEKSYGSQLISIRRKLRVDPGEVFRIKVFFKNTGTMPWFSNKSSCLGPKVSLGADNVRDRASVFYQEGLQGWEGSNRVGMDQYRTDPGEIASFTFWGNAGEDVDVYKEYWTPVAKDLQWIDDGAFSFEVMVGDTGESAVELRRKMSYIPTSGALSKIDLSGEKSVVVDLSDSKAYVKIGDYTIREFPISAGKASTPTPVGETTITLKQEVRIASKSPYYIMPNFMWFRAGGYGFHALPSLGSSSLRSKIKGLQARGEEVPTSLYEDDSFWTEAKDHIGRPASHGCVRLLPEDSDFLFDFAEIGTRVVVQK